MTTRLEQLEKMLQKNLGSKIQDISRAYEELTVLIDRADYAESMQIMRDSPDLGFQEMIDLCGVDYSGYGNGKYEGPRFAVVVHLLSLTYNWRVRVKVFVPDGKMLRVPTIATIWSSADWYEREAFDLFGIHFDGHPDLRRILTDYGFVGYPLRKDFPVHGYVEMRYDEKEGKVIYEPVTIEQREITPRVIRDDDPGRRS